MGEAQRGLRLTAPCGVVHERTECCACPKVASVTCWRVPAQAELVAAAFNFDEPALDESLLNGTRLDAGISDRSVASTGADGGRRPQGDVVPWHKELPDRVL